jgi:hypothetical protein
MVANQHSSFQLTILSLVKTELYLYKKMSTASKIPRIVQGTDTIFIIGKKSKNLGNKNPGKTKLRYPNQPHLFNCKQSILLITPFPFLG